MPQKDYLPEIEKIITSTLKGHKVKIYGFGSVFSGCPSAGSDIDLAVQSLEELPIGLLAELRERLAESTIPFVVDLVEMNSTSEHFAKEIRENGRVWIELD